MNNSYAMANKNHNILSICLSVPLNVKTSKVDVTPRLQLHNNKWSPRKALIARGDVNFLSIYLPFKNNFQADNLLFKYLKIQFSV